MGYLAARFLACVAAREAPCFALDSADWAFANSDILAERSSGVSLSFVAFMVRLIFADPAAVMFILRGLPFIDAT